MPQDMQAQTVALPSRLPLMVLTSNRDGSTNKDARLVNCYLEADETGELWIYKRPGLEEYSIVASDNAGYGIYYWRGSVYTIFGSNFYRNGTLVGSDLDTTGGVYRFDSNLGAEPQLIFGNGVKTYAYTEATGMVGPLDTVDSDFPALTVKGFAYLNGYEYVMTPDAYIQNSELNSVNTSDSWNAINFIRAQIEPDNGVFLGKQLVYVVAIKQWSTEFFFDAGNAEGSPLGPVQGLKNQYGCSSADSVRLIDDILFWLCTNRAASKQIVMLERGAASVVSTPAIDRLLANADTSVVYSWNLKITGHNFYIITLKNSNLTLAYDIVMKKWFQWTDVDGNYFPIVDSSYNIDGTHLLQHESNGKLYKANVTIFTDDSSVITVDIITPIFDAGIRRRKMLGRMWAIADQTQDSQLAVRFTDDDYSTWSSWRYMDLSQKEPYLKDCGTFRKRAYHLRHDKPTHFRIQAIEVQYDIGTL